MKTIRRNLQIETLEDRALLSASPLGEIAAPAPEPIASLAYNFGAIEGAASAGQGSTGTIQGLLDEGGQCGIVVNKLRGSLDASPDDGAESAVPATSAVLRPRWDRIIVRSITPDSQADIDKDTAVIVVTDHGQVDGHGFQSPIETTSHSKGTTNGTSLFERFGTTQGDNADNTADADIYVHFGSRPSLAVLAGFYGSGIYKWL